MGNPAAEQQILYITGTIVAMGVEQEPEAKAALGMSMLASAQHPRTHFPLVVVDC